MKIKDKGFTPILISFDEEGYKREQKKAEDKLILLNKAHFWINEHIPKQKVRLKKLHTDILGYFNDLVLVAFKEENTLGLSAEKITGIYCRGTPLTSLTLTLTCNASLLLVTPAII